MNIYHGVCINTVAIQSVSTASGAYDISWASSLYCTSGVKDCSHFETLQTKPFICQQYLRNT